MNFSVGDVVYITDGKNTYMRRINGIRNGYLRVGHNLFDWCGNPVDRSQYRIYPIGDLF